jgi:single-strand DNA-binding protein
VSSLNRVVLVGRLTRDPEMRTTTNGNKVANFGLAVDRMRKSQDGQDVDFFNVSAWGNSAEFVANYLTKGRLVAVEGRLQTRKYTTQDGQNREVVEIVADNVQGLDRPRDDAGGGGQAPARAAVSSAVPNEDEFDPFAND